MSDSKNILYFWEDNNFHLEHVTLYKFFFVLNSSLIRHQSIYIPGVSIAVSFYCGCDDNTEYLAGLKHILFFFLLKRKWVEWVKQVGIRLKCINILNLS